MSNATGRGDATSATPHEPTSAAGLARHHTERAPKPVGPYVQAVRAGGFLFCSGQIAIDPATGGLIEGDVEAQTRQVMANLRAVLEAAGTGFERVVKTTIFLVDMNDFQRVNRAYGEAFASGAVPARTTVAVAALPLGARIEIEMTGLL